MAELFLRILNVSITAGWIVLGVLALRFVFGKSPKWTRCLLWGIVALRLLVPVSFQSSISLIPSAQVFPQDLVVSQTPAIHSGIPAVNSVVNPLFTGQLAPETNLLGRTLLIAAAVWLAGVAVMLLAGAVSWLRLRRRLRVSLLLQERVYICDDVDSPFVFGLFRPGIYLPSDLPQAQLPYVLAHEKAHLRRLDHWWKPLGYLLLTLYWFNPLLWVGYILLCRDVEQACDEKVIKQMEAEDKKHYSEALLACSVHRRQILLCPVAFGEVAVKTRIKGIVNYKKPAFWVVAAALVLCLVASFCFLTDPVPCDHDYQSTVTVSATCTKTGVQRNTCATCQHSYTEKTAVLAHRYDEGVVLRAATCLQEGILEQSCTDCGGKRTQPLERSGHTAGDPYYIIAPHCTKEGQKSATCTLCGEIFATETLPVNNVHNLKATVVKAATCDEEGTGIATCTRCGYEEGVTYEKTAHSLERRIYGNPNCVMGGAYILDCKECGYYAFEWIDPTPYHYVNDRNTGCNIPKDYDARYPFGKPTNPTYDPYPIIRWAP